MKMAKLLPLLKYFYQTVQILIRLLLLEQSHSWSTLFGAIYMCLSVYNSCAINCFDVPEIPDDPDKRPVHWT